MPSVHRFAILAGLCCLGHLVPATAAAQGATSSRQATVPAVAAEAAPDRRDEPGWRTGALMLGGLAAVGFMYGRRRYD